MMLCLSYRSTATALLAAALMVPGCIEPISLGPETDDAGGSDDTESDGATSQGSATSGPGTATTTGPGTDDGPATATDGPTDDGPATATDGDPCPPIDIANCVECECFDGEWACSNTGCVYDCEGFECGVGCMVCPDEDPECTSPEYEGVCTALGECVGVPPPKAGFCEGALQPGFEMDLEVVSGCIDMLVFAHDVADERGVVVMIDQGLVADAVATGMPVNVELSATDPSVTLEARAGQMVTALECNDVAKPGVEIDELWLPVAGTIIVDVVPDGFDTANATVQLVDVELQREQPGPETITFSMTMSDVYVGWLPG